MSNNIFINAAIKAGFQYVDLKTMHEGILPQCIELLPIEVAERNRFIVIHKQNRDLVIVVDEIPGQDKMATIRNFLEAFNVTYYITSPEDMDYALNKYYIDQLVPG